MKRIILTVISLFIIISLPSCSKGEDENRIGDKIIPKDDVNATVEAIMEFVAQTGNSVHYTLNVQRTEGDVSYTYIYKGDGNGVYYKEKQQMVSQSTGVEEEEFYAITLDKNASTKTIYQNGETKEEKVEITDVTLEQALNECIANDFFDITLATIALHPLKINQFEYVLPQYYVLKDDETIFFDEATIKLDNNYRLVEFHCESGPQKTSIVISDLHVPAGAN